MPTRTVQRGPAARLAPRASARTLVAAGRAASVRPRRSGPAQAAAAAHRAGATHRATGHHHRLHPRLPRETRRATTQVLHQVQAY